MFVAAVAHQAPVPEWWRHARRAKHVQTQPANKSIAPSGVVMTSPQSWSHPACETTVIARRSRRTRVFPAGESSLGWMFNSIDRTLLSARGERGQAGLEDRHLRDLQALVASLGVIVGLQLVLTTVSVSGALATAAATVVGCVCYLGILQSGRSRTDP